MATISEKFDRLGQENPGQTYRLGIMGGTFDPIHIGHLVSADQAREAFDLDAVIFMPAFCQPFKEGKRVTEAHRRYDMCQLAIADNPNFDASRLEINRGTTTYTAETLAQLREFYPDNVELYFITGADAMLSIVKWRDSDKLASLAHFIAVTRPGYEMTDEAKAELAAHADFDIAYLETTGLAVSSSMLRKLVAQDKSIRYLTPDAVLSYIIEKDLYQEQVGE